MFSFCLFFLSLLFLARRLEREVKEILDDFSSDETLKANLLKGKRVDLAEELSEIFYFVVNNKSIRFLLFRTCSTNSRKIRRIYSSIKYRKIIFSLKSFVMLIITHKLFSQYFFMSLERNVI
jgi:hypothetical protein